MGQEREPQRGAACELWHGRTALAGHRDGAQVVLAVAQFVGAVQQVALAMPKESSGPTQAAPEQIAYAALTGSGRRRVGTVREAIRRLIAVAPPRSGQLSEILQATETGGGRRRVHQAVRGLTSTL